MTPPIELALIVTGLAIAAVVVVGVLGYLIEKGSEPAAGDEIAGVAKQDERAGKGAVR